MNHWRLRPALLLSLLLLTVAPAAASTLLLVEQGAGWEDNYLRLSDDDQERFRRDAAFQARASALGSWRLESRLYLRLSERLNPEWRLTGAGNLRLYEYPENNVKDYQAGMLYLEAWKGRQDRLRLQWDLLHDFYLRDYRHPDRDLYSEARFHSHTLSLAWNTTRLNPVELTPVLGRLWELYRSPFPAYDLIDSYLGLDLAGERFGVSGQLRYRFHWRDNVGYDPRAVAGGGFSFDSEGGDASAHEQEWRLQLAHAPGRPWLKDITLQWRLRYRRYLTGETGLLDPVHAGRIDRRQYLLCELEFPLPAGFSLESGWQLEWRRTGGDWSELSRYKDYRDNRYWLNLKYRWYRK